MSKDSLSSPGVLSVARWRRLFEAALLERDPKALPSRLHDAKHAVMDRVEESFKDGFRCRATTTAGSAEYHQRASKVE